MGPPCFDWKKCSMNGGYKPGCHLMGKGYSCPLDPHRKVDYNNPPGVEADLERHFGPPAGEFFRKGF